MPALLGFVKTKINQLKIFTHVNYDLSKSSRGVLLKGKAQYSCVNQLRSAPFYIEKIINLFYKTSYFNKEVNCTEPPLVCIPW